MIDHFSYCLSFSMYPGLYKLGNFKIISSSRLIESRVFPKNSNSATERGEERENAAAKCAQGVLKEKEREIRKKRSGVRHEGGGVPMSRMENDPPRYTGVSRFPISFHPAQPLSRLFSNDSIRMCFLRPLRWRRRRRW